MPHVSVDDIDFYYQEVGDGPPVILVHHYFGTVESWLAVSDTLRRHFQVIGVDLRAHGRSGYSGGPLTVAQFVDDVAAMLQALMVRSAHLIGASVGAIVCACLAASQAIQVRSLTLIGVPRLGASPRTPVNPNRFIEDEFPAFEEEYAHAHRFHGPDHARAVLLENFKRIVHERWEGVEDWFKELGRVTCPVLVMAGDNDRAFPPSSALELASHFRESELCVLPRGGHLPHRAVPHITAPVLLDFLLRAERRWQSTTAPAPPDAPERSAADEVLGG